MKKYPVIYKDKEYEVRWIQETCCGMALDDAIIVYEVLPRNFFKYKKLDEFYARSFYELYDLKPDDENLYVKQAMYAVKLALQEIEAKNRVEILEATQQQKLQEWDGVIKEV